MSLWRQLYLPTYLSMIWFLFNYARIGIYLPQVVKLALVMIESRQDNMTVDKPVGCCASRRVGVARLFHPVLLDARRSMI